MIDAARNVAPALSVTGHLSEPKRDQLRQAVGAKVVVVDGGSVGGRDAEGRNRVPGPGSVRGIRMSLSTIAIGGWPKR